MAVDLKLGGEKLAMAAAIFLIGITFGLLPLATKKVPPKLRDRVLGVCNAFAAGIFIAAGSIHLFNESIELFDSVYPDLHLINPAFILAPFGFFVTFVIDKVLFLKEEKEGEDQNNPHTQKKKKQKEKEKQEIKHKSVDYSDQLESSYGTVNPTDDGDHGHGHGDKIKKLKHEHHDISSPSHGGEVKHEGDHQHVEHDLGGHGHAHGLVISEDGKPSLSNYILVIVLSFHSILAGFVMGLDTDINSVLIVFLALISHHWIESFALGASLLRSSVHPKPMGMLILFFACMAPTGVICGMLLISVMTEEATEVLEAYMVGIAAGSFLYVATIDILVEEFLIVRDKWMKTIALLFGFCLEGAIVLFFEELAQDRKSVV